MEKKHQNYDRRRVKTHLLENRLQIKVKKGVEKRDAKDYSATKTLGLLSLNPENLAILAGAGDAPDAMTRTMIVLPTLDGSLYTDQDGEGLFADYFLVFEEGSMRFVQTNEPIPIDALNIMYSMDKRGYEGLADRLVNGPELPELTNDKIRTKGLLQSHGIRVPLGVSSREHDGDDLESAINRLSRSGDLVVKPSNGSGGKDVQIFDSSGKATDYAKHLASQGKEVIIEERIVSDKWIEEGDTCDWNVRYLVSLSEDPKLIDCEIRIDSDESRAINISKGAYALDGSELSDKLSVFAIFDLKHETKKTARAIFNHFKNQGKEFSGFLGIDLIVKDGQAYVIEVNSGAVGGLGTLSKIRKAPVTSVRDILVPELGALVERGYAARKPAKEFKRIKPTSDELCYMAHRLSKSDYQSAKEIFSDLLEKNPEDEILIYNFSWVMVGNRDYDSARDLLQKGLELHPKSKYLHDTYCRLLLKQKAFLELEKIAKEGHAIAPREVNLVKYLHAAYRKNGKRKEMLELERSFYAAEQRFSRKKDSPYNGKTQGEKFVTRGLRAASYLETGERIKCAVTIGYTVSALVLGHLFTLGKELTGILTGKYKKE